MSLLNSLWLCLMSTCALAQSVNIHTDLWHDGEMQIFYYITTFTRGSGEQEIDERLQVRWKGGTTYTWASDRPSEVRVCGRPPEPCKLWPRFRLVNEAIEKARARAKAKRPTQ